MRPIGSIFRMNKLKEYFGNIIAVIIGIFLIILFIPILIFCFPFFYIRSMTFKKRYNNYIPKLEGKSFFIYNNRMNAMPFIKSEILPRLKDNIEIIFLDGTKVVTEYKREMFSHMLHNLDNYDKFPHLMKVRDGQVLDHSINNEFYNVLNQNKPIDKFIQSINAYFETELVLNVA